MKPKPKKELKPKPKKAPVLRTPYSVRAYLADGKIQEVATYTDRKKAIARVKRHHRLHGLQTWAWNVRTGDTIFELQMAQKGGAA